MKPKPGPPRRFRSALVLTATIPVGIAALVAFTPLGSEASTPVLTAGVVSAVGVAVAVFLLTRRLAALSAVCEQILAREALPESVHDSRADELGGITRALLELDGRRRAAHDTARQTREAYRRTLTEVAGGLGELGEGAAVTAPGAGGPCEDGVAAVTTLKEWPPWLLDGKPSPAGRIAFTTWRTVGKDFPLQASGLLGPVSLQFAARVPVPKP